MSKSKFDKVCCLDGTHYKYCSGCSDYKSYPRYMETVCSENCHNILKAVMDFRGGASTIETAREILKSCDLSKKDNYPEIFRSFVDDIMKEPEVKDDVPTQEIDIKEDVSAINEAPDLPAVDEVNVAESKEDIPSGEKTERKPQMKKVNTSGYKKATSKKQ